MRFPMKKKTPKLAKIFIGVNKSNNNKHIAVLIVLIIIFSFLISCSFTYSLARFIFSLIFSDGAKLTDSILWQKKSGNIDISWQAFTISFWHFIALSFLAMSETEAYKSRSVRACACVCFSFHMIIIWTHAYTAAWLSIRLDCAIHSIRLWWTNDGLEQSDQMNGLFSIALFVVGIVVLFFLFSHPA